MTGEGACNNVYKVTVRIGAGGEDGTPGEPTDSAMTGMTWSKST